MSAPIDVDGAILSEFPDGTRVLEITSKTGQYKLRFSKERWTLLADSARWFHERVKMMKLNGKVEDV